MPRTGKDDLSITFTVPANASDFRPFFSFVNQILRTFFYFLCLDGGRWMIGWDKKRGWLLGVGLGDGGLNF